MCANQNLEQFIHIHSEYIKNTEDIIFLKFFLSQHIIFSLRESKQNCFRNIKTLRNCKLVNKETHLYTRDFYAR